MGLLDNLYLRETAPGDLPFRRPAGVVQALTLAPAVYGMRVEIPRVARRLLPYALDIESGIGEGNVARVINPRYLPAPSGGSPLPPPVYTPPTYQYPPGAAPPPGVVTPPGTVAPPVASPPGVGAPPVVVPAPGGEFPIPSAPGYRRAFNLQFTADTSGSLSTQELRVTPAIGHPFRVTEIAVTPLAGVTVGQYIDVLVVANAELVDESAFLGSSLFENPAMLTSLPAPDGQRGIAVPLQTERFTNLGPIFAGGQQIKAVLYFVSPAVSLPLLSVTLVVEEVLDSTPPPPARVPPVDVPPYAEPPYVVPPVIVVTPAAPPAPPVPSGTLPIVPQPNFGFITVVPGVVMVPNMVPQYDASGHMVGYVQDPGQVAQWAAIRAVYLKTTGGPVSAA